MELEGRKEKEEENGSQTHAKTKDKEENTELEQIQNLPINSQPAACHAIKYGAAMKICMLLPHEDLVSVKRAWLSLIQFF